MSNICVWMIVVWMFVMSCNYYVMFFFLFCLNCGKINIGLKRRKTQTFALQPIKLKNQSVTIFREWCHWWPRFFKAGENTVGILFFSIISQFFWLWGSSQVISQKSINNVVQYFTCSCPLEWMGATTGEDAWWLADIILTISGKNLLHC